MRISTIASFLAAGASLTLSRTIIIKPGDTQSFSNDDDVAHTLSANDNAFDSGDFDKGTPWTTAPIMC